MRFREEREASKKRRGLERRVQSVLRRIGGAGDGFLHRSLGILEGLSAEDAMLAAKVFSKVKDSIPEYVRDTVQMAILRGDSL